MKYTVLFLLLIRAGSATPSGIAPFLGCVSYDASSNQLTAFFGYVSTNPGSVIVSEGSENFASPAPNNRGQTTVFLPGANPNAWQVTFDVSQTPQLTWTLLGQSVTASNDPALYCSSCVCPAGPQGPQGNAGVPGNQGTSVFPVIRVATVTGTTSTAIASCKIGETVVGGAGSCTSTTPGTTSHLSVSIPAGLTWKASCDSGRATAVAICASDPTLLPPGFPH